MDLIRNVADIISGQNKQSIIKPPKIETPPISRPRKVIKKVSVKSEILPDSTNSNEVSKPAVVKRKVSTTKKRSQSKTKTPNNETPQISKPRKVIRKESIKSETLPDSKSSKEVSKPSVVKRKVSTTKRRSQSKTKTPNTETPQILKPRKVIRKDSIKIEVLPVSTNSQEEAKPAEVPKKTSISKKSLPDKDKNVKSGSSDKPRKESTSGKNVTVKKESTPAKNIMVRRKSTSDRNVAVKIVPDNKVENLKEKVQLQKKNYDSQIANMKTADKTILQMYKEKEELLKQVVVQAQLDRKVFSILHTHGYVKRPIREELLNRGWLEHQIDRQIIPRKVRSDPQIKTESKIDHTENALKTSPSDNKFHVNAPVSKPSVEASNEDIHEFGTKNESFSAIVPRTRRHSISHPYLNSEQLKKTNEILQEINPEVSFIWLSSKPDLQLKYFLTVPNIGNKFQKTTFCSKLGLCNNLKHFKNLMEKVKFPIKIPRMYNLGDIKSENNFMTEYYIISAASILKWFVNALSLEGVSAVQENNGEVPTRILELSIRICERYVKCMKKDENIEDKIQVRENWDNFLAWFYKIINTGAKFAKTTTTQLYLLHCRSVEVLRTFREVRPETEHDGFCNLWIVKPYHASCGRGIFITNNLQYLNDLGQKRYIVQKYIERPYLIRKTKFDIRQWFLVTNLRPMEIWLYKESYLRFCTQPFDIRNLHESVHLTNNAVQKKYAKEVSLPCQNMWDSTTFQKYLWKMGYFKLWEKLIYPSMRDAIVNAMLCSQPTFDQLDSPYCEKKGWFEIYGADFLLTSNLRDGPWLIEINESPALNPSTPITEKLCQQMLRDVIKVVVDRVSDEKAETGNWELVYKQKDYTESRA